MSRTCSGGVVELYGAKSIPTFTSGCDPAASPVGVTVNERTSNAAWAEAGAARRRRTRARSERRIN
jgi:hypothetical protein